MEQHTQTPEQGQNWWSRKSRKTKIMLIAWPATILFVVLVLALPGSGSSPPATTTSYVAPTRAAVVAKPRTDINPIVISEIKSNAGVIDAAVSSRGQTISLVLVVQSSMNKSTGQNLGENFVRLYKSMSDDDSPGQSVGKGKYDYLVSVYYPNEKLLAQGAKVAFAERITW